MQNHQPQRAAANDGNRIAGVRARIFKAVHGAGQRLSKRSVLQRNVVENVEGILGNDTSRDADELGIGAVVEEQIVAEVFLAMLAEIALPAGGGVERNHAVAGSKVRDSFAHLNDRSRQLVAKERRGHDHARMVAAAKDLQIGSAGERGAHAHNQLARFSFRKGNLLNANIFAPVEDSGLHGAAPGEKRAARRFCGPG